ncbi:MAG: M56 family metallopeptidase [Thermoguttaceae bacterium]|jgi:beta-lactamase regulating signal transducer with metallopeptidase domain
MSAIRLFLFSPLVERLGWGLLHFLWQGAVIAAMLAAALRVLRGRSPNVRYLVGWVALVVMACAVPLTAWLATGSPAPAPIAVEEATVTAEPPADASVQPARIDSAQNQLQQEAALPPATDLAAQPVVENRATVENRRAVGNRPVVDLGLAARASLALRPALPWLVGGWLAGALVIAVWHLGGWWQLGRLRRVGTREAPDTTGQMLAKLLGQFALLGPVKLLVSARVAVPTLIGWLRPVILVPASVLAELPPQQLELILAHELAHLRRCDYLLNLVQTAVETLLFYHPAVWWVSRQIRVERENCCDELAAAAGDRLLYARALASLAELCRQPPCLASSGLALGAAGGSLSARIRRVLRLPGEATISAAPSAGAILALVAILATAFGFHVSARQGDAGQPGAAESTEVSEEATPADSGKPAADTIGNETSDFPGVSAKSLADEARRRIAALATPDETLPYYEQAVNWLSKRREQIVAQLIVGLDDKNSKVAQQCLRILHNVPVRQELTDALIAKAGDEKSPLRYGALRQLEKSAADPRVARLLDQASTQVASVPDLLVRARWAWLAGHKDRATDILKPLLQKLDDARFEHVEAIRLLGEIGGPASVELLRPIAAGHNWGSAVQAYRALAKIDPANHGLTKDQATLLKEWGGFKETSEHFRQRMGDLAKLSVRELRPLVMQMLGDTGHSGQIPALSILTAWKDKDALPQIRALMRDKRSFVREDAVAAYLAIDDGQQAQKDVLDVLVGNDIDVANDHVLQGIVMAETPSGRKLAMLRAARAKLMSPDALPNLLMYEMNQGRDVRELLAPLMDEETDPLILGSYCDRAAEDKEKRFGPQVRRAMKVLAGEPTVSAGGEDTNGEMAATAQAILRAPATYDFAAAAQAILRAAVTYDLKDLAPEVRKLMGSENAAIRAAAQAAGARLGVRGAGQDLYAQLDAEDLNVRELAAKSLMDTPPTGAAERAAREEAVLSCLGKPCEESTMRILATCGGEKTVKALEPILDGPDARRAVYAAWVLAQLSDQAVAAKALRRVAIFAMFHHQDYQGGKGIDFHIAPHVYFHQVTGRLNPDPKAYTEGEGPVRIPDNLLVPFAWDDREQQYAVRCYQLAETGGDGDGFGLDVDFLARGPIKSLGLDRTHLPLLKEIAAQDSHLKRLMVKGQALVHFQYRQRAAKAIATITGEKAAYRGLSGEKLDSDAFPEPYPDQASLLARFFVDWVQKAQLRGEPQTARQWQQLETYRQAASRLQELFGPQVVDAIRQEAKRRAVGLKHILPEVKPAKPSTASPAGPPAAVPERISPSGTAPAEEEFAEDQSPDQRR